MFYGRGGGVNLGVTVNVPTSSCLERSRTGSSPYSATGAGRADGPVVVSRKRYSLQRKFPGAECTREWRYDERRDDGIERRWADMMGREGGRKRETFGRGYRRFAGARSLNEREFR